jgi:Glycosyl hydrolases family 16
LGFLSGHVNVSQSYFSTTVTRECCRIKRRAQLAQQGYHQLKEGFMKIPRRQFLNLAASAAALPMLPRVVSAQTRPWTINSDPAQGVFVDLKSGSVEFALNDNLWIELTGGPYAGAVSNFCPASQCKQDLLTMNMANWGNQDAWYSSSRALKKALGFGTYEQSIKVGAGKGLITTFYLSELGDNGKPVDQMQEIDFELSGYCNDPGNAHKCGTASAWTNVWWEKQQKAEWTLLKPQVPTPNTSTHVYRYKIDWQPSRVVWWVDTGAGYVLIRTFTQNDDPNIKINKYVESKCNIFISFWHADFLGSNCSPPEGATGDCGASGKCYQAFYFGPLRFTPSPENTITRLGR